MVVKELVIIVLFALERHDEAGGIIFTVLIEDWKDWAFFCFRSLIAFIIITGLYVLVLMITTLMDWISLILNFEYLGLEVDFDIALIEYAIDGMLDGMHFEDMLISIIGLVVTESLSHAYQIFINKKYDWPRLYNFSDTLT